MTQIYVSLAEEMSKKTNPAPYDRIPTATKNRAAGHSVDTDIMVTMRDDIRLACDVYLPEGDGPFPTILTRLPYGKNEPYCHMNLIGAFYTSKGYAHVVQDVRGKWGSEGNFNPNMGAVEVSDGFDTIDWVAKQDWSTGRIGMWGESYYGFTTYAGAVSQHPALVAIASST